MIPLAADNEGIGCRTAILAGLTLLAFGLIVGGIGLSMVLNAQCNGLCTRIGLAMFYAGAPGSALFGVVGGGVPIAWPIDAGIWVSLGITVSAWSDRLKRPIWQVVAVFIALAFVYGAIATIFVDVVRA